MSVEPNFATAAFLGETLTFVDCPGSVEFLHDMRNVAPVCDAAVVVCEADERKVPALEIVLRELEEADIPRFLFINKIDTATRRVRETLEMLQRASRTPLLLRQIPIWKDGIAVGFIDLALERAFVYREHAPSEVVELPDGELPREKEARFSMLERLADHDDASWRSSFPTSSRRSDRVFEDLARELRERQVVPVLIGSADRGNGVTRLLKALRHEAPRPRRHPRPARRRRRRPAARAGHENPAHGAWRQAVGRARPARPLHGRRHRRRLARRARRASPAS